MIGCEGRGRESRLSGLLVILSGPSGVGKTTVCRGLAQRLDAFLSVSATTRPRRDNEVHGQDYYFLSKADFEQRLSEGRMLEHAEVYGGNYYGTPAEPVVVALAAGRVVILEIEIEGTIQAKQRYPQAVGIYLTAPTSDEQVRRLVGRKKDSPEAIVERLNKAMAEVQRALHAGVYDYFVVNDDVEAAVDAIAKIVQEKQGI